MRIALHVGTFLGLLIAGACLAGEENLPGPAARPPAEAEASAFGDVARPATANDKEQRPAGKQDSPPSFWLKVPPVRLFPRPGNFQMPPTGPGYYSLHDVIFGEYREKPPRFPYPAFALMQPSFFDADFRYLESPANSQHDLFDPLHRCHLGDCWLFATGGAVWWRHMHEVNSRLTAGTNDYDLIRTRVFGDLWYLDRFRIYAEMIDAHSFNQDLAPASIDVNRTDLLNAFVDLKLFELNDRPAYVRVGRQELLLGSQRLISTLDWANTRRTFQGIRGFRQGKKFDVDLFWVQPVIPDPSNFDSVDNNVNFAGLWTTYRAKPGRFLDGYYLFLDNTNRTTQLGLARAPFHVHTLGSRWAGDHEQFLWDVELMLQVGKRSQEDIIAGASTVGGGYHFAKSRFNPIFWVYYDYASGDPNPGRGSHFSTFNQLFPFGHYYLGWLDLVGRQNIHDVNLHLYVYPAKWITVWSQYHHFWLDSRRDALYNAAGVPIRRDATGQAGRNVGDEIDLIVNFHLGAHSDVLFGYSKLFGGQLVRRTGAADSAELFYFMYNFRW